MRAKISVCAILMFSALLERVEAFSSSSSSRNHNQSQIDDAPEKDFTRRNFLASCGAAAVSSGFLFPISPASAKPDCMTDCLKNCKQIAPKDPAYCLDNCTSYCAQEDRTDGLSGSVSSDGGEVGILGRNTVVKGEDKPPSLSIPGLDFSSEKGKKLIGY